MNERRNIWGFWFATAAATLAIHAVTLRISPTIWTDEVQIVDYGRVLAPGADRSYAMTWSDEARVATPLMYIGNSLQNAAYVVAGGDLVGPRLSAVVGAVLASAALLGWLLSRGVVAWIALACALLFLWDPVFAQGYRGARVDSWAMALMLSACWVVRSGKSRSRLVLAGICTGVAGLTWVSAILLLPLLAHEVVVHQRGAGTWWRGIWQSIGPLSLVAAGAVAAMATLLTPYAGSLPLMLADLAAGTGQRTGYAGWDLGALFAPFRLSPWLVVVALLVFVWPRNWSKGLVFLVAAAGVMATSAYIHRAVYLLPYLLLGVAVGASALWQAGRERKVWRFAAPAMLGALMLWSGGISLGARTLVAWSEREVRDPEKLVALLQGVARMTNLQTSEGGGAPRVFLGNWELYYAARGMGWRFDRKPERWSDPDFSEFIRGQDLVIYRADEPALPDPHVLESLGFEGMTIASNQGAERANLAGGVKAAVLYADYVVWRKRPESEQAPTQGQAAGSTE
jgi:hypothetical protein